MSNNFLKDKTLLYVEDELEVLENISELLKNYFGKIYSATDGEQGYELFLEHKIDILLVDIELPKMNGIELINKIREHYIDIYVVVISAYTKTDYLLECIECKIDKYIVKPFTSKKINELLEKLNSDFSHIESNSKIIQLDSEFSFNTNSSELIHLGKTISLSKKELTLLKLFLKNQNRLVSIMTMEYEIWPEQESSPTRRRSLVSRLRSKLNHKFIETNSSEGYIFKIRSEQ